MYKLLNLLIDKMLSNTSIKIYMWFNVSFIINIIFYYVFGSEILFDLLTMFWLLSVMFVTTILIIKYKKNEKNKKIF